MPEVNYQILEPLFMQVYRIPSITAYNRLESSPRTEDFTRSLKAEVRDALWMLTRQWQFGEFQGEDAASPVTAQILGMRDSIDRMAFPNGKVFGYEENIPMEVKVEPGRAVRRRAPGPIARAGARTREGEREDESEGSVVRAHVKSRRTCP